MKPWLALWCALVSPRLGHCQTSHPWSVYLRDGGQSPLYAFAGYSVGRPVLMVGAIVDSPNDYTEYLAGGGVNLFAASGNGASLLVLGSKATDSWYLEVYGLPTLTAGRLSATGFAGLYLPVESRGVRQYFLDPVTVLCRVHRWFALGGSYTVYKIAGLPARHGAGPAVQIALPSGSATIDALAGISSFTDELRLTLQFAF